MPIPNRITASDLPRPDSANPPTNRITFTEPDRRDDVSANNAAALPSGAPRCHAYKKSSNTRCSRPAYPGSLFCSQDHQNWDKKANGTTHRVFTAADTDEELAPPDTSEEHDGAPNLEASHSKKETVIDCPRVTWSSSRFCRGCGRDLRPYQAPTWPHSSPGG